MPLCDFEVQKQCCTACISLLADGGQQLGAQKVGGGQKDLKALAFFHPLCTLQLLGQWLHFSGCHVTIATTQLREPTTTFALNLTDTLDERVAAEFSELIKIV